MSEEIDKEETESDFLELEQLYKATRRLRSKLANHAYVIELLEKDNDRIEGFIKIIEDPEYADTVKLFRQSIILDAKAQAVRCSKELKALFGSLDLQPALRSTVNDCVNIGDFFEIVKLEADSPKAAHYMRRATLEDEDWYFSRICPERSDPPRYFYKRITYADWHRGTLK